MTARAEHQDAFAPRLDLALKLAAIVHRDQVRKGTSIPYLIHPVHVARVLERHGYPEYVVVAGLLHDVLEDIDPSDSRVQQSLRETFRELADAPATGNAFQGAVHELVGRTFGEKVVELVDGVTERKTEGGVLRPWPERKREALDHLRHAGRTNPQLAALKAADVIHNTRSIAHDLDARGLDALSRFNAAPDETLRYYRMVSESVRELLGDVPIARELAEAVDALKEAWRSAEETGRR
jgi:(p)ppGpp synthase/HD superfamily hydrolase